MQIVFLCWIKLMSCCSPICVRALFSSVEASGACTCPQRWWPHVFLPAGKMVLWGETQGVDSGLIITINMTHWDVTWTGCVCVCPHLCAGGHSGLAGEEGSRCHVPEPPHIHSARRPGELPEGTRLLLVSSHGWPWSSPQQNVSCIKWVFLEHAGRRTQSRFLQDSEAVHRQGNSPTVTEHRMQLKGSCSIFWESLLCVMLIIRAHMTSWKHVGVSLYLTKVIIIQLHAWNTDSLFPIRSYCSQNKMFDIRNISVKEQFDPDPSFFLWPAVLFLIHPDTSGVSRLFLKHTVL